MSDDGLTERQRDVLRALIAWTATRGRPPSLRELADALGYRHASAVQRHLEALKRKGAVQQRPGHRGTTATSVAGFEGEQADVRAQLVREIEHLLEQPATSLDSAKVAVLLERVLLFLR